MVQNSGDFNARVVDMVEGLKSRKSVPIIELNQ